MYKQIETVKDQKDYKKLWNQSNSLWGRKRAIMEANVDRYLFINKEKPVGIMEINPIQLGGYSNITPYYPNFYEELGKTHDLDSMFEIGKLFIQDDERTKGHLKSLFTIINNHHEKTGTTFYTSVIVEPLFHSLKKFGVELILTEEPVTYKGQFNIYPVIIDPISTKNNPLIQRFLNRHAQVTSKS